MLGKEPLIWLSNVDILFQAVRLDPRRELRRVDNIHHELEPGAALSFRSDLLVFKTIKSMPFICQDIRDEIHSGPKVYEIMEALINVLVFVP